MSTLLTTYANFEIKMFAVAIGVNCLWNSDRRFDGENLDLNDQRIVANNENDWLALRVLLSGINGAEMGLILGRKFG